jgi:plastocyanin
MLTSILSMLVLVGSATATTFNVDVAPGGLFFSPSSVTIQAGDTVKWTWKGSGHSVTAGLPGHNTGLFDSGVHNSGFTFSFTFSDAGTFDYHCTPHGACCGMIGKVTVAAPSPTPTPTPTPRPPSQAQLLNVSTRMNVQTGENVLIGGFIVTGSDPKKVILRAIGPSLPLVGALSNPTLELHDGSGTITSNDNWMDAPNKQEIIDSTIPPINDLESAIVTTLPANNSAYTAIVSGVNNTTGIGLVEAYDLDQPADSQLANISTRGFVESRDNVMIGGFILGNGTGTTNVLIRALGPSLAGQVSGVLADPILELHDENGNLVQGNDNWKDTQQIEIEATGIPPTDDLESAIIATLPATPHTAIVSGKDGMTGVALVEVYRLP